MLIKLLKYECKTTWGTLYPVALGVLGVSTLLAIMGCISASLPAVADSGIFFTLHILVTVLFGVGLFAAMLACVFVLINRFYRLLGEEGYLMLSLPATPFQQIAAKLICAVLTTVLAFAVGGICGMLGAADGEGINFQLPSFGGNTFDAIVGTLYGWLVLLLLLAGAYLFIYLCIAIAGHWPQQRLLASIISYFVLTFLGQIVFFSVMVAGAIGISKSHMNWEFALRLNEASLDATALTVSAAVILVLLIAGFDAILWAVTQNQMTKHLNLP